MVAGDGYHIEQVNGRDKDSIHARFNFVIPPMRLAWQVTFTEFILHFCYPTGRRNDRPNFLDD